MKKTNQITCAAVFLFASGLPAIADQQIPALDAINRVSVMHGVRYIAKIVEMKGERGQAQPEEWELIVYDPTNDNLMREFWIGDTRATNEGGNDDYYPRRQPAGFINLAKLKYGSVEAFRVLDREAARARIGFDSIDYHLRCREFSDEPIWTLTAKDSSGRQVARLDLSGFTGRVLRTVWCYRKGRKVPLIRDSALLGLPKPAAVAGQPAPVRTLAPEPVDDGQIIGPARRSEPLVPAPIAPGEVIDPGTEVPEVVPIEPDAPAEPTEPELVPVPRRR
ncbi:MAG: hypothetical protein ACR2RV_10560 [Verrucomicrobiales bacterium]